MPGLIYLATPYSDPDPAVRLQRFEEVSRVAALLTQAGMHVFSPISHTHQIALAGDLPNDWEFWEAHDRAFLAACEGLIVLRQTGWQESTGVTAELAIAREMGIMIEYMDP